MSHLPGYPSIHGFHHKEIADILLDPVVVQEKVDGSQFTFGLAPIFDGNDLVAGHVVQFRSKGAVIDPDQPPKDFALAVAHVIEHVGLLVEGLIYRGEAITSPKHNTLKYDRAAKGGIVLFDVEEGAGTAKYLPPSVVQAIADDLGVDVVPTYYEGALSDIGVLSEYLTRTSVLGGKVEGVVVKNYDRFGRDHKPLFAKLVSEEFRELHGHDWKMRNPNRKDIVASLIEHLKTEARWRKVISHFRDDGKLLDAPQDIGPLLHAINADILAEEGDRIKALLFDHFWKEISKGVTRGFAEFYKAELTAQFIAKSVADGTLPADVATAEGESDLYTGPVDVPPAGHIGFVDDSPVVENQETG